MAAHAHGHQHFSRLTPGVAVSHARLVAAQLRPRRCERAIDCADRKQRAASADPTERPQTQHR
jgi:hypothetical protein